MRRVKTDILCPKCKKAYLYQCEDKAYDSEERPCGELWYECEECDEMFWPEDEDFRSQFPKDFDLYRDYIEEAENENN